MKKFVKSAAVAAIALAGILGGATSASAAASDCPANTLCFFADGNFTGTMYSVSGPQGTWVNVPGWFNDQMSSWVNNLAYDARWSVDPSGGGSTFCMNSGNTNPQVISSRNDLMSAYYIYFSNAIC